MPAIRRLAAILAADIAGYSRLMGADGAGTARALREHGAAAVETVRLREGMVAYKQFKRYLYRNTPRNIV